MHNPTADDIIEDLKRFPDHNLLPLNYDSLGSPYTAFKARPEVIRALPGLTPDMVTACLMPDRERIRQSGYNRAVRDMLVEHGLQPVAEDIEESPAQEPSSIPSPE